MTQALDQTLRYRCARRLFQQNRSVDSIGQRNTSWPYWLRGWPMVTSRIWFTAAQKAELWERWKSGSSAAAISRALDRRNKTGVLRIVTLHGGIAPAPRRRALAALRLEEREEISRGIAVGHSIRRIAQGLGRAPPTVSRELRRNGGSQRYRANPADRRAWERALRPKPCRLAHHRGYDGVWHRSSRCNGHRSRSPAG